MTKETGGSAFPLPCDVLRQGMDLRDYFAAKAMHGYLSDIEWHSQVSPQGTAETAYRMADEMLKARNA